MSDIAAKTSLASADFPSDYEALVAMTPPRAVHDEIDYQNALELVDKVLARPKLAEGQENYIETWSILISDYEDKHHALEPENQSPQ